MRATESNRWLVPSVVLTATALRFLALCKFSLGNDEIAEVTWARLPWRAMMAEVRRDRVHPPLDYIVQWLLSHAGASECVRRLPSVFAGIAAVALAMLIAKRLAGNWAAGVAGVLLAFSPTHIRFSQEVRPYSLALCFLLLSIYALLRYREEPRRLWVTTWWASVLLAGYTLYFAGMIAAIGTVALLLAGRRDVYARLWRRSPLFIVAWAIAYSPWLSVLLSAATSAPVFPREPLTADWALYRLQTLATGDWQRDPVSIGSWAFWLLVVIGIVIAVRNRWTAAIAICFVIGTAIEIAILQLHPHFPAVRHLLPSWIAAFILAGIAAERRRAIAIMLVLLVIAFEVPTLRAYVHHGRVEWRKAAQYVVRYRAPGEPVTVINSWGARNFGYYWQELGQRDPVGHTPASQPITLRGPLWVVISNCPMPPASRARINELPLRRALPYTNGCELRYVPAGTSVEFPEGICSVD